MDDLKYLIFTMYLRRKMRKFLKNNYENLKCRELMEKINIVLDENAPEKILKLEKRMLK
jgi:hypothetical protein